MIPTNTVIDLISAFKSGERSKIDKIIKEIIGIADKRGQVRLVRDLRKLYSQPNQPATPSRSNDFAPQGSIPLQNNHLFERRISNVTLDKIILSARNKEIINEIQENYLKRSKFIEEGIASENKVLLYGKPWTWKTLFAYVLWWVLELPVLHVHLDSIVSSYLGDTGKNIRNIFEEANRERCILFIDEFDSIAKKRDDSNELGELKRVVTVLLQNIDSFSPNSVLVAATNHEHLLDDAIWRRFDYQLNLDVLDGQWTEELIQLYLKGKKDVDFTTLTLFAEGLSGAIIKQSINKALRKTILSDNLDLLNQFLIEEILRAKNLKKIDFKSTGWKKKLSDLVAKLREIDPKYYTLKKIEEITGIPDSSLSYNLNR